MKYDFHLIDSILTSIECLRFLLNSKILFYTFWQGKRTWKTHSKWFTWCVFHTKKFFNHFFSFIQFMKSTTSIYIREYKLISHSNRFCFLNSHTTFSFSPESREKTRNVKRAKQIIPHKIKRKNVSRPLFMFKLFLNVSPPLFTVVKYQDCEAFCHFYIPQCRRRVFFVNATMRRSTI